MQCSQIQLGMQMIVSASILFKVYTQPQMYRILSAVVSHVTPLEGRDS